MVRKKHSTKTTKYRSRFEAKLAPTLLINGYKYEAIKLPYVIPASNHNYTPDFIKNKTIIELKGRWTREDRKKILYIHSQYSYYNLIMVFQNPNLPIYKGSKVTYAKFCDKMNIKWIDYKHIKEVI